MKYPTTARNARRSLVFENTPEGRVIVGAMWLPMRIIADTKEQAVAAALKMWGGS